MLTHPIAVDERVPGHSKFAKLHHTRGGSIKGGICLPIVNLWMPCKCVDPNSLNYSEG
jgi:hypothetical protein